MTYQERLAALVKAAPETRHREGDGCDCWRCLAHRMVLEVELSKAAENAVYREHLDAVRRRARRQAAATAARHAWTDAA